MGIATAETLCSFQLARLSLAPEKIRLVNRSTSSAGGGVGFVVAIADGGRGDGGG